MTKTKASIEEIVAEVVLALKQNIPHAVDPEFKGTRNWLTKKLTSFAEKERRAAYQEGYNHAADEL